MPPCTPQCASCRRRWSLHECRPLLAHIKEDGLGARATQAYCQSTPDRRQIPIATPQGWSLRALPATVLLGRLSGDHSLQPPRWELNPHTPAMGSLSNSGLDWHLSNLPKKLFQVPGLGNQRSYLGLNRILPYPSRLRWESNPHLSLSGECPIQLDDEGTKADLKACTDSDACERTGIEALVWASKPAVHPSREPTALPKEA